MDGLNKPFLITKSLYPENQETPIKFLQHHLIPTNYHFKRNHFNYPKILTQNFLLPISGEVVKSVTFYFDQIINFPATTFTGLLECAGNNRSKFEPKTFGEQWEEGAISQGRWRGVSLSWLLSQTGLTTDAKEVLFEGYDFGKREDSDNYVPFARSLPLEIALHPDTIIAYEYNDKLLSIKHGFPLRLIVPGWYGMASVKWLKKITVINYPFTGPFQAIDYVYYPKDIEPFPVTTTNVNSIIQYPLNYSILDAGNHTIEGIAWSGEGDITTVEISFDGHHWSNAILLKNTTEPYAWTKWKYQWNALEGEHIIFCRATDSKGRRQPMNAFWNKKGYGYNATSKAHVKIT